MTSTNKSTQLLPLESSVPPTHIDGIDLQSLNLWSLLHGAPPNDTHSFAYDCALRALQEENRQGRPPASLAWKLLERKRMWINGTLDLHTYDSERLVVRELLRQNRQLALKERHPFGFAAWAHLGSLETLAAALGISHQCGIKTSASALKAAAARANTQPQAHSIIAVESELLWQKVYLVAKEKSLQIARMNLLSIILKRPTQGILEAWKQDLEAPLFGESLM